MNYTHQFSGTRKPNSFINIGGGDFDCNWFQNILRVLNFCNALLKFTVNMHGMHLKDEKDKMIVKAFKFFFFFDIIFGENGI